MCRCTAQSIFWNTFKMWSFKFLKIFWDIVSRLKPISWQKLAEMFWKQREKINTTVVIMLPHYFYIINKTLVYMLYIADQTAGPIGLKFFVDTHGLPGGVIGIKSIFSNFIFFHGQRRALQLVFKIFHYY